MNEKTKQLNIRIPEDYRRAWKVVSASLGMPQDRLAIDALFMFFGGHDPEVEERQRKARKIVKTLKGDLNLPFDRPLTPLKSSAVAGTLRTMAWCVGTP